MRILLAAALLFVSAAHAQFVAPVPADNFKAEGKSILRPPAGSKVAVLVFEDLGCPACAANHPYELQAVEQAHIPLVRYDFPFVQHVWTFEGAVCARYIQDHINAKMAGDFRSDVFAAQRMFSSPDDIDRYTRTWLQKHGQQAPFVLDPGGKLAKEVTAERDLGNRLNVEYTPTIIVVTKDKYQVVFGTKDGQAGGNNISRLPAVIEAAQASTSKPAAARHTK